MAAVINMRTAQGARLRSGTSTRNSFKGMPLATSWTCKAGTRARNVINAAIYSPVEVSEQVKKAAPENEQSLPGNEEDMKVKPMYINDAYKGSGKLEGKRVIITGGDSGIGRAVAVHFAREGAKSIAIIYKNEDVDAKKTEELVKAEGCTNVVSIPGDVGDPEFCQSTVEKIVKDFGGLDVLINNAGEQHKQPSILDITPEQLQRTFATDIFAHFYMAKAAIPHLKPGSAIVNTTSVLGYLGKDALVDYASAKGAVASFTRSLAIQLVEKGIRVNGVAPGPVWTPAIPASMGVEVAGNFGEGEALMGRGGQPCEVAPSFVFLASDLFSSFFTGQVLHPNGGMIFNA